MGLIKEPEGHKDFSLALRSSVVWNSFARGSEDKTGNRPFGLLVPIATIQAILGHASSSTTSRYVHMGMPLRRKAGEALAELWREHQDQGLP